MTPAAARDLLKIAASPSMVTSDASNDADWGRRDPVEDECNCRRRNGPGQSNREPDIKLWWRRDTRPGTITGGGTGLLV